MKYQIRKTRTDKYRCGVCDEKIDKGTDVIITGYGNSGYSYSVNNALIHVNCLPEMIEKLVNFGIENNIL